MELCAKRALAPLKAGLTIIFCVGETLEEREGGRTDAVLKEQLSPLLENIEEAQVDSLLVAYEPVWAIGTGKVASLSEIESAHEGIDNLLQQRCGRPRPILYGGSVSPDNFREIAAVPKVGGALVGGASLKADKFSALYSISEETALPG